MTTLIAIAVKSLLVAGITLLILRLMKGRSAAERSTVAHVGLLALVVVALAPLVLPSWNVETPSPFERTPQAEAAVQSPPPASAPAPLPIKPEVTTATTAPAVAAPTAVTISPVAAATAVYAVPAAILLIITLLALGRLLTLRARADVLVDGTWLSALARAQRRMGFKHGTALLTSDELSSPISWGLMRPVILLNSRAVEASGEAEAIIAHELAHVARLDWVKLLVARVTTALFWFNPLVWMLAKEAHQLREEAADDSVLAANVADTDYAQLLVGIARHECRGLLIGAHGVAPGKGSLARRVARVLDPASQRGPVARSFALGMFAGAMLVAAPLAALTLTPAGEKAAGNPEKLAGGTVHPASRHEAPSDLPTLIAQGVSTSVETAVAAVAPADVQVNPREIDEAAADAAEAARDARQEARERAREAREAARDRAPDTIDDIIEMKAVGVTPEYVAAMRSASPSLRAIKVSRFADLKAVGVTPEFARDMAAAGFRNLTVTDLQSARAVGITGDYARGLAAAGLPPNIKDYVQLRAVGVPVRYVIQVHKLGHRPDADKIVEMYAVGVQPGDLRAVPAPPATPVPPRTRVKVKSPRGEVNVEVNADPDPGDG